MNIRQMAFKIKSRNTKQHSSCRLNCPDHGCKQCKPVLNRRIATHQPEGRCGSRYHGHSTEVMDDLNECVSKILHIVRFI